MNDRNQNDSEATVKLPAVPIEVEEFDPEKTVVVEDWSKVAHPTTPVTSGR